MWNRALGSDALVKGFITLVKCLGFVVFGFGLFRGVRGLVAMGRRRWIPVMVVAVVVMVAMAGSAEADMNEDRVAELKHLQAKSQDGVIRMDDNRFRRFVATDDPRPYAMILFFDAQQLREQTELRLEEFRREFGLVASSYIKHNEGGSGDGKVFFCDVEFKEAQGVFRMFDVQTLPHVRHLAAGSGDHKLSVEMNAGEFPRSAEGVAAFVTAKTRQECGAIERPPFLSRNRMLALLGLFLVSAPIVGKKLAAPGSPLRDYRVWMVGALAIYFFSVSGGMHNIIRNMPLFTVDRNDPSKLQFFYHGSGMQFGTEGFIVGFLYTIVGVLLAYVTHFAPNIRSKNSQRMLMVISITISFVAVSKVIALDNWKTDYWIHAFWPTRWT